MKNFLFFRLILTSNRRVNIAEYLQAWDICYTKRKCHVEKCIKLELSIFFFNYLQEKENNDFEKLFFAFSSDSVHNFKYAKDIVYLMKKKRLKMKTSGQNDQKFT